MFKLVWVKYLKFKSFWKYFINYNSWMNLRNLRKNLFLWKEMSFDNKVLIMLNIIVNIYIILEKYFWCTAILNDKYKSGTSLP